MRRSHLTVLAGVSFAALVGVSTTSSALVPPSSSMGTLKQQDQWKIGTVDAAGSASYCAMVSKYEQKVVLAFARSQDGLGSVAMDFSDKHFEPGAEYEVTIRTQGTRTRSLIGRASSDRSVVVQIGQDEAFFNALGSDGAFDVKMPSVNVTFALRRFASAYESLVECAQQLSADKPKDDGYRAGDARKADAGAKMDAVKVKQVEQASLAPIDREVQKLSMGKDDLAAATAEADTLSANLNAKTGSFDEMEAQLDREAKAEQEKSKSKLARLDSKKESLTAEVEKSRQEVASLQTGKPSGGRQLLASMDNLTRAPNVAATAATVTAAELEQQQMIAPKFEASAPVSSVIDEKVAALQVEKNREADRHMADFGKKQAELTQKKETLEKERSAFEGKTDRSAKAGVVAKTAEIAAVNAEKAKQSSDLTKKLSATEADFQSRIAALEAERDGLQKKLDVAMAANFDKAMQAAPSNAEVKALGDMKVQLDAAEKNKQEMANRLDAADKQNKLLQASLAAKEMELASSSKKSDEKNLAALQAERESVQKEQAALVADLQRQLTERTAQYDGLKKQMDEKSSADQIAAQKSDQAESSKMASMSTELSEKQAALAKLEEQLKQIDVQKTAEAERAQRALTDLAAAREQIAEMKKGLGGDQQRLASLQESLTKQKAELDQKAADQTAEAARLDAEKAKLEEMKTASASPSETSRVPLALVPSAETADKVAQMGAGVPVDTLLASEKAELEESRSRIKSLEEKYAQSQKRISELESAPHDVAQAVIPTPAVDDTKMLQAQAEIERLRAEKAMLESKLSSKSETPSPSMLSAQEPSAGDADDMMPIVQTNPRGRRDTAFAVPAVPAVPVIAEAIEPVKQRVVSSGAKMSNAATNRASAFLDKIMTYHRPGASGLPAEVQMPKAGDVAAVSNTMPVTVKTTPVKTVAVPVVRTPVASMAQAMDNSGFANIETASGSPEPVEAAPSFLPSRKVSEKPALASDGYAPSAKPAVVREPVASLVQPPSIYMAPAAPAVPTEPVVQAAIASPVTSAPVPLEKLLKQSGMTNVEFVTVVSGEGEYVKQWTTGNINGMFELTASNGQDFDSEVQDYLARYRDDCPANLDVNVGSSQAAAGGSIAVADVTCKTQGNAYTTSFVFLENSSGFGSILHTGTPADTAKVRNIGDNIAYALGTTGGIAAGVTPARKAAVAPVSAPVAIGSNNSAMLQKQMALPQAALTPSPAISLKFKIPPTDTAAASYGTGGAAAGDDFETVVVQ